jgi:hypothetical protein
VTGPLEATIYNLQHEIGGKGLQGRELQRRWIQHQTELVALQNENAALTEDVARLKAERTVVGSPGLAWARWVLRVQGRARVGAAPQCCAVLVCGCVGCG